MTRRRLLTALAALVVAAALLTGWLALRPGPDDVRPEVDADGGYRAGTLPEDEQRAAVQAAAEALPAALSYDYRTLDDGLARATGSMTDSFGEEYRKTFDATTRAMATDKKAVTSALVRGAGVVEARDDRVLCLVFVDQMLVSSATTKRPGAPVSVSGSRVLVEMRDVDGTWKIDSIDPF